MIKFQFYQKIDGEAILKIVPNKEIPACRNCHNEESCETNGICNNWSLADFAAHLLTHEEKNIDPEINETLKHMAEHDETHLHQIQSIVSGLHA
jgi:hypothetical protein